MKIISLDIYRYSVPTKTFTISSGQMEFAGNVLVVITTDSGLVGYGECSPFPSIVGETQETALALAREMAPLWIQKNPLKIEERMAELHRFCRNNPTIKSAFDMALHDIAAQDSGLPLYRFLGGKPREIRTDMTVGIVPADQLCAEASREVAAGAKEIKVKVGINAEEDVDKIRQLRATLGPEIKIRLDANQGWSFEDAVWALQAMDSLAIEFCEQPMHAKDDEYLPALRKLVRTPIMADESCYVADDARRLINRQSCDYINIKLAKCGSIGEALRIQNIAGQHGVTCMIGGMLESRLGMTACLHFALASEHVRIYDLDSALLGFKIDPVIGGAEYAGFELSPPETPGIGATIDPAFLAECERWTIS